jgi:hypothetical protein
MKDLLVQFGATASRIRNFLSILGGQNIKLKKHSQNVVPNEFVKFLETGTIVHLNSLQAVKQFLQLTAKGRPLHVARRLHEGKKLEQELLFDPEASNQGFSDRFDRARIFGMDLAQPPFKQVSINAECMVDIFSPVVECNQCKEGATLTDSLAILLDVFYHRISKRFSHCLDGICLLFL